MSQVSIFESFRDDPDPTLRSGVNLIDDLHAVISRIPCVGHARGTWRENTKRPAAYLHFRPDLLDPADRVHAFKRADVTAGLPIGELFDEHPAAGPVEFVGRSGAELPPGLILERADGARFRTEATTRLWGTGSATLTAFAASEGADATPPGTILRIVNQPDGIEPEAIVLRPGLTCGGVLGPQLAARADSIGWWVRINGEPAGGEGRRAMKQVVSTDPVTPWRMDVRFNLPEHLPGLVLNQLRRMLAGASAVGCAVKGSIIYAETIAQLVLAAHWTPEILAGVGLALAGASPLSDLWMVSLDAAAETWQPWAEPLAKLTARGHRDVLVRALTRIFNDAHHPHPVSP